MATIGTAVLQIVPSLEGVTEAIEKQVAGKTIKVSVQTAVDTKAVQKAGKEAGEVVTKEVNAAVRKGKVGKTVTDEITSSAKSSAGKEAAKAIVDGIATGVKQELPRGGVGEAIVEGIADGVKQGIDGVGLGGQVVDTIGNGIKSRNLGGTIKDAIVPAIKGIGDELRSGAKSWAGGIADSLRSGDIQGATTEIGDTVRTTTDLISEIGSTFGLQLDGVRVFGDQAATTLSDVGTNIGSVITTAQGINDTFNTAGDLLEKVLPGKAGTGAAKIADALGKIAVPAWLTYLTTEGANKIANDIAGTDYSVLETLQQGVTAPIRISGEIFGTPVPDWADPYVRNRLPNIPGGGGPNAGRERAGLGPVDPTGGLLGGTLDPQRRGYGAGGYTGTMPVDKIAGVVHGGEYVINASSTKGIENAYPGLLSYLNNQGDLPFGEGNFNPGIVIDTSNVVYDEPKPRGGLPGGLLGGGGWFGDPSTNHFDLPGYESGGKVQLGNISGAGITTAEQQSMWDAVRGKFPGAVLTSATRSVMTEGHPDFHNAGRAIDISGPGMGAIASWIASTYPDSLELIHSPFSRNIKNGKNVGDGNAFYGAGLMAAHRNHVHWALGKSAKISTAVMPPTAAMAPGSSAATAQSEAKASTGTSSPSAGTSPSSSISLAGSFSGLAAMGGEQIGKIPAPVTSPNGQSRSLENIGSAVGQVAAGQVSSALGVLGVNDAPGWLQGASKLISGISIGDSNSGMGSAAPVSASSGFSAAGTAVSSIGAGMTQAPVSQVNYNIQTTDIEPAYLASQRLEKERSAATLARIS